MRRTAFVSMIVALLAAVPLVAQQTGRITGTVTSADGGRPLAGAAVTVAGTAARAVTSAAGTYALSVAPGPHQVTASVLGHAAATRSVTVAAGETATLDFQLRPASVALEGVVAIGYGEQRARAATGSVQAVTSEQFNTGRVVSPEQLIQSKVAGVQVVDSNEPGGGISVRIRGATSITSSNEPLFVVDGIPLAVGGGISAGRNPLNFLNPNDIESVTVLKDASSTAIYGSRGANGVVLIKTKAGSSGAPRFSYTTTASTSRVTGGADLLGADQFRAAVAQYAPSNLPLLGTATTNWRDAVERSAPGQDHELALAGAGQDMDYRLSLGYLDQKGVIRGTELKRTSGAFNYNQRLFDNHLNVRANFKGTRSDDSFTPGGVLGEAVAFAPTQPIRTASGGYFEWTNPLAVNNPVAELDLISDHGTTYRSVGGIETQYRFPFLEALAATVRLGYDVTKAERAIFSPSFLEAQKESAYPGSIERRNPTQSNSVLDAFANYARPLDRIDSNIDLTAGYSYEASNNQFPSFIARGLKSDLLGPNGVPGSDQVQSFLDVQESKLASFFARMNYGLRDRYLLMLSLRRDESSRFGPNQRWGTFPAIGLGWRVIDEPFMKGVGAFSDLKLRASWGVNGNQSFGNYLYLPTYSIGSNTALAQFGNEFVTTIRPGAADPNLKWEETTSYDVGADYGLFGGRVSGSLDYYVKNTDDLIFNVPVAAGSNLSNYLTTNIGSMRNRGFEMGLSADVLRGGGHGLSWTANFNASTNTNRLLRINAAGGGTEQILTGGISGGVGNNIEVLQPGFPINSFFVYHHIRDANGKPVYADTNGDGTINELDLYQDRNGDHNVNQADRAAYKSPTPKWILGHTSQMGYGNVDLGFTLRAYLGNYVYNNVASNLGYYGALRGAAPTNLHTSVLANGFVEPQYFSDVYVEDASFLRMDNLTLGYTLKNFRAVRQTRIFGTVQNVFTATRYSGVDPTAGLNGIDNNIYPRSRTFSAGVSIGF